jgi:hypothetical protein
MRKIIPVCSVLALLIMISSANAETGTIRIETADGEYWPVMLESPADFEIWVEGAGNPTNNPNILLVMTEASWNGLTNVVVTWSGGSATFTSGDFMSAQKNSDKIPPGTTSGGCYSVASLKDHLSYGLSEPISAGATIYWAMKPFLAGPLTHDHEEFSVELSATSPRMLVYAVGKIGDSTLFDNKVPPTRPGFVVPELGTGLMLLASFGAFALYALKRRKPQDALGKSTLNTNFERSAA